MRGKKCWSTKLNKGYKFNNFPFWQLILNYLGLEDIEKVMTCCKNFYEVAQDDRILEKFVDSDDEDESESEDTKLNELQVMKKSASKNSSKSNSKRWKEASK